MTQFFDFARWVAPATGINSVFLILFVRQVLARGKCSATGVPLIGGNVKYSELLEVVGLAFLRNFYHALVEADRLAEMRLLRDLLQQRTQALIEANHRKDNFLAMLAHELRSPLTSICHAVRFMHQVGEQDDQQRWARDVIERQVQHMARLVDDLLDVSRIASGKIWLQKEPVDLGRVVTDAVETCRPIISARRHELTVTLPPQRVMVEADRIRLAQVLVNLLNNAAKYTEDGGHIALRVEQEDDEVFVRVQDDGLGIAAEMLPSIFDQFTQANRSAARSQGGLGLGLSLVRSLVKLHGGSVQASSDGPGCGSEFVVRLPVLHPARCLKNAEEFSNPPQ